MDQDNKVTDVCLCILYSYPCKLHTLYYFIILIGVAELCACVGTPERSR